MAEQPVAYGMSRMLVVHLESNGMVAAVFRTLPEASARIVDHREGNSAERHGAE